MRNWIVDDLLVERGILAAAVLARIVDEELALRDAGGAEGVGLDDVRAGLKKAAMDVADHLRLRQREEVAVVQQVLRRVLEALAADVRFRHAVGADGRAHRSIDDGDAALEDLFQRMLVGFRHVSLMALSVGIQPMAGFTLQHTLSNYIETAKRLPCGSIGANLCRRRFDLAGARERKHCLVEISNFANRPAAQRGG